MHKDPSPRRAQRLAFLAGLAILAVPAAAPAPSVPLEIELEVGAVWQSRNDAEIPNDGTATRFALDEVTGAGPWPAGRVYVTWHVAERHAVRLLWAPLSITERGSLPGPVDFAGASYAAGTPVEARYTFNSYRATYRWRFHTGDRSRAWLGFTAKIRDATVALTQGSVASRKDDLGFVPLLHLAARRELGDAWDVSVDVDALGGGPGRAIDAALELGFDVDDRWSMRAGYRTVEGGADVDSVYNFAWLHYAALAVVWRP
mgnify:FL=1